ncbi:hypothetical protein PQ465_15970 [Sphingobacterium oryzagri]|uniref:Uncharacterized protein n=1 Tax=Sphingobacterium oryzagri TaxID=3025669 RepID=A0ABY7WDR5_9SPHI|nr:hypothetical protein [Sphingobacterium sp. KACC 22765]WDF67786.1 hypothetical protein PQ465_15970 [Sphingobacterium sp. KACC 22765]
MKTAMTFRLLALLTISISLTKFATANIRNTVCCPENFQQDSIIARDTVQIKLQSARSTEFNGILIVDDKIESDHNKLHDKDFAKTVKKFIIREKATAEDVKRYGSKALNGIMFITTK